MKIKKEVNACDFCKEEVDEYPNTCEVCGKVYCDNCSEDDTWGFTDTSLCKGCNEKVWEEFPKLIKKLKEGLKK